MRKIADSGQFGYGVAKGTRGFFVKLPLPDGTEASNTFKNLNRARQWQLLNARVEWGLDRFHLMKRGRTSILRKFGCGVSVRKTISRTKLSSGHVAEYQQYGVFWYDHNGNPKSEIFSYKKYGDDAEIEAHWFAAKQRAKLTASELNVPTHWYPRSFDLDAAIKVNER
ncbi:hypothetical protein G5Y08_002601 [Vibrio parahaemolyticus]|uniref:hypothetical protein n=1 Tax=Vibrio parahaemolyticus TaxID=670 RepID=UPI000B51A796|nr:hypothetical protein [Vibrio parahaemolyticus]EGQ8036358.1 hypothetical protein [Vibrio parahaemolyticus]EGR9043527.1 hypothetical protein [Vibrio parahaemolyticus]EHH2497219.1 hypothetical protein [Vibrio parahaemolyticus]EID4328487.1 hypothetical protein [Vibrio parahaemolyticus]EJI1398559.1 hypothetical protein [Vibrio parahaemolyticus]